MYLKLVPWSEHVVKVLTLLGFKVRGRGVRSRGFSCHEGKKTALKSIQKGATQANSYLTVIYSILKQVL